MKSKGPIAWMIANPVAANLLMLFFMIGGVLATMKMRQEVFPSFDSDRISIAVAYPGADPEEIETGILKPIEEAIRSIEGIKLVQANASEGVGGMSIQTESYADPQEVLSDVKNQVDRLSNWPEDAEEAQVSLVSVKSRTVSLILAGPYELKHLRDLALKVRDDLLNSNRVSQVDIEGTPNPEVLIEVSALALESYGLSMDRIAQLIQSQSSDVSGGSLKTQRGTILVQLKNRQTDVNQLRLLDVYSPALNQTIKLGEIANIRLGFAESDQETYLDGQNAVELTLYSLGKEKPTDISDLIYEIKDSNQGKYPEELRWQIWQDRSEILEDRISLLQKNAISGGILVLVVLALFLHRKLAFWVAMGIPISFLGAFFALQSMDLSINMISLFALIVTLGIVVDDAIVVSENVYSHLQNGESPFRAAIIGAREMAMPVSFSILTTIAAFAPLLMVEGNIGKTFSIIPAVVIVVLILSWLESFYVLPAHLAHSSLDKDSTSIWRHVDNLRTKVQQKLDNGIQNYYSPFLRKVLGYPFITITLFTLFAFAIFATIPTGILSYRFFPKLESSSINVTLEYPFGTPIEVTRSTAEILEKAARKVEAQLDPGTIKGITTEIGATTGRGGATIAGGGHKLKMRLDIGQSSERNYGSNQFVQEWKKLLPPLPGIRVLQMDGAIGPAAGKDAEIELSNENSAILQNAAQWLSDRLRNDEQFTEVENGADVGTPRLELKLKPQALSLGLSSIELGRMIRSALQGFEVYREQVGQDEVRYRVQLPPDERKSLNSAMKLPVPINGNLIPLGELVDLSWGLAPASVEREDGRRLVRVKADVTGDDPQLMINALKTEGYLAEIGDRFPGTTFNFGGQQKEQADSMKSIIPNYGLALLLIYILLAIPFQSYLLPLVVMLVIPYGLVGAFTGHLLMGFNLSFVSLLGCVALSGVVVNDSLVFVDAFNRFRKSGSLFEDALIEAGTKRFRPILLTSLTTFFGLMPMIFETSIQAKFLIPMAISLGFGALFVTVIVLVLIPVILKVIEPLIKIKEEHVIPDKI